MLNYKKLMAANPTKLGEMTNSLGQKIEFLEHPYRGDDYPIIVVCHELKLAATSDFYDTDDMVAEHGEYAPSFQDGKLFIGEFEHED